MSDAINKQFRASYGLDAAGEKLINVALADRTVMSDGINVEYMIQENTIQAYSETRAYPKGFAVMHNDHMWVSIVDIAKPSGVFNEAKWEPLRVDPKWILVDSGVKILQSGQYISVDTSQGNPIEFTLPSDAIDGDTIVVKDIGGRPGFTDVVVKAGVQSIVNFQARVREVKMTIPYSQFVFVYNNRLWQLHNTVQPDNAITANTSNIADIQSGQTVIRQYNTLAPITMRLPKNANNGDIIHFVGMDKPSEPYYHLIVNTFDANTSVEVQGQTKFELKRSFSGYFIFNSTTKTWALYDADLSDRLRTVGSDTLLFPGETVSVVGTNNTTIQTITLTLPQGVSPGDQITVALNYMRKGQTVKIIPSGTDKILTDMNMMQFPKRSSYPPAGNWVNTTELSFSGTTSYPPIITFAYIPMGPISQWMVVQNVPQLERVDPTDDSTRARLGVIALATQAQANLNHENITAASKEVAITPETLANRTATETRRGIAEIATTAEVNQVSTATYLDDVIVTPKKLNERAATETMRGLAEIATQAETNAGTDDITIITPKKLEARRATPTMAGIAKLVNTGGLPVARGAGVTRDNEGTGIFAHSNFTDIVTPKTLREMRATELSAGIVFLATENETIAGATSTDAYPLVVTPDQLHKKTATEGRIGFSEIATQAETNAGTDDFRFITPKKLAGRGSTETMTGVARIATQSEFDSGTLDNVISTPLKIKTYFNSTSRTSVNSDSGLVETGTLWNHYNLNILEASITQRGTLKLSDQTLTNTGVDDTTAVTPKTLHNKKSTQTTEGIIRTATNAEATTGTSTILAITPATLKHIVQNEVTWEATTTRRGMVKLTEGALTFVGNDTVGSTAALDTYLKTGYAISPYELNKTLANYMPLKAKAVDADKLDGLDSLQFIRRDINQVVDGNLTLNSNLIANDITTRTKFVTQTGRIESDSMHYIDLGKAGINKLDLGSFNAVVNIVNTSNGSIVSSFSGGNATFNGKTTTNSLEVTTIANVNGTIQINSKNAITLVSNSVTLGDATSTATITSSDAGQVIAKDGSGSYRVLTEKNFVEITDRNFVNQAGDTMSGRLTINAPSSSTFTGVTSANIHQNPTAASIGTWTVEITDSAIYNQLNGYLVPIYVNHPDTGLPILDHYDEVKSGGTLSQFGTDLKTSYQIWVPKPTVTTQDHTANTMWIRHFNVAKNAWDGFGRVYTSNQPPTAADIGAMSNDGSMFNNFRVRDWIQIGNMRIYADQASRTVKFDWID